MDIQAENDIINDREEDLTMTDDDGEDENDGESTVARIQTCIPSKTANKVFRVEYSVNLHEYSIREKEINLLRDNSVIEYLNVSLGFISQAMGYSNSSLTVLHCGSLYSAITSSPKI